MRTRVKSILFWFCCLSGSQVSAGTATDLGVIGQTYPITEPSLLESIHGKLQAAEENGELAKIEEDMKARFIAYAHRPTGIKLPRASRSRVRYFDPTVRFDQAIKDAEGKLLWPAGTTVNPLDYVSLSRPWLFFDGDDPKQTAWARAYADRHAGGALLILTRGPILELMDDWETRLYFDQGGRLVERFGIQVLPTMIRQDGRRMRLDEVVPEDGRG